MSRAPQPNLQSGVWETPVGFSSLMCFQGCCSVRGIEGLWKGPTSQLPDLLPHSALRPEAAFVKDL